MKKILLSIMSLFLVATLTGCANTSFTSGDQNNNENTPEQDEQNPEAISFTTKIDADYEVSMEFESYGTVVLELDEDKAPETVKNFVSLVEEGFYDGLTLHRIMAGFMMQGGDPTGTGYSGSDKEIYGEFAANGFFQNNLSHTRGAISMARSQNPDSASSQFFIVHENSEFLDGSYAAFGYVVKGMEIVDAICNDAQPTDDNGTIPAESQPVITKVSVRPLK